MHWVPHVPPGQVALPFGCAVQVLPQAPQLLMSVLVARHEPLTNIRKVVVLVCERDMPRTEVWRALYGAATLLRAGGKFVIAVNDDIDPDNADALRWAMAYRMNPVTAWLARRLVTVKYANLINLVLDRPAIPELLLEECRPAALAEALETLITDEGAKQAQRRAAKEALERLGRGGAQREQLRGRRKAGAPGNGLSLLF